MLIPPLRQIVVAFDFIPNPAKRTLQAKPSPDSGSPRNRLQLKPLTARALIFSVANARAWMASQLIVN